MNLVALLVSKVAEAAASRESIGTNRVIWMAKIFSREKTKGEPQSARIAQARIYPDCLGDCRNHTNHGILIGTGLLDS